MPKSYKFSGFTLIEVMLAMTLLSIMVTLLFGSLKICAESWNKGEAKIAEVNEKAVVYQFFKRHLPSVQPLWDDFSEEGTHQFSFQGGADKVQFVSVFPASSGRKGLQIFEISFDQADHMINIIVKPFYPALEEQEWQQEQVVLLENVEAFKISYFAKQTENSGGTWAGSWREKEMLPALIKINIELKGQSFWPDMVFALKLAILEPEFKLDTK